MAAQTVRYKSDAPEAAIAVCFCNRMDPTVGPRPPKTYRGSLRRLRRIKVRGHGSWELWILAAWVAFLLIVVIPWLIRHTP